MEQPLVSVIIPVYNAAAYVQESLESILRQTYQNLEVLVFNDGSKDNSAELINAIVDPRLKFYDSQENVGYVEHLNRGLELAQGKYIARMDADDVAWPERIAKQVALMENQPEIGACGSWIDIIDHPEIVERTVAGGEAMRFALLANSPMAHPTVMMRTAVLQMHKLQYDAEFMPAEDYMMWYRISQHSELANLQEVLLSYRRHEGQISSYKTDLQRACADRVRLMQLEAQGFTLSATEKATYCRLVENSLIRLSPSEYADMKAVMNKLAIQNDTLGAYKPEAFRAFLRECWLRTIYYIKRYQLRLLPGVLGHTTSHLDTSLGMNAVLRLIVKSAVGWKMRM